jgi:thymidine phosphorylase
MTPLVQEVLRRKRDGRALTEEEIAFLVAGIADGSVSDAQVGALAMAVVINGMTPEERVALTGAMTRSGEILRWDLGRPVVDKHSTGGVGDKVSLLLAPMIAACGAAVPMISGRGLGHTGGTLDKLDAIPGYDTAPDRERFASAVREAGCAIIGQTADLAPADRRLYAVRDATGTVESIPLIVASILSKKLAAGLDALVMDVKVGSGAFLPDLDDARALAEAIVEVAGANGLPTAALLTDMDQVLGRTAGNAVEVREAIDHLTGEASDGRLVDVTVALCEQLLALAGLEGDPRETLRSGAAAERFAHMVRVLGGPSDLLERPDDHLPRAPVVVEAGPDREGVVAGVDVRAVGLVVIDLGGGRRREDDEIDHAVGLTDLAAPGERVGGEHPLATVHARSDADAERAVQALRQAFRVGDRSRDPDPVVLETLTADQPGGRR